MRLLSPRRAVLSVTAAALVVAALGVPAAAVHARFAKAAIKYGGTLTVVQGPKDSWVRNFNPIVGSPTDGTQGIIYEPLLIFNQAKGGKIMRWLASGYKWGKGNRSLTFTLRRNVRWNDGVPFTSADVAFDLQLDRKYNSKGLSYCGGCWTYVKSVTTPDKYTVVINFKQVNTTALYYIGTGYVVPKHIFAKVADPTKFTNPNPVATGAFKLGRFSPQVYTLVKNKLYWRKGEPYLDALRYPAYKSNEDAQLAAVNQEIDWGGIFIPNAADVFVKPHPTTNKYWYAPVGGPVALYLNLTEAPFNNVHVRRAISYALNRTSYSKVAEYGYEPAANAALIQPQFMKKWGDSGAIKTYSAAPNLAKAKAELAAAGNPDLSKPMTIHVVDGWSDWVTMVTLIANDLKAIGMNVSVVPLQFGEWFSDLQQGKFDMQISWTDAGYSPFTIYRDHFLSTNAADIGQVGGNNWERYKNPKLDALITAFQRTSKTADQIKILKKAQRIVAADVPIVPLTIGAQWYEYTTKRFVGWPDGKHPYDLPAPWAAPENGVVAQRLHLR